MILPDIHDHLADAEDQAYFRRSREARFGMSLEAVAAGREAGIEPFRLGLAPLRRTVATQPFLGGEAPLYPDYMCWAPSSGHAASARSHATCSRPTIRCGPISRA
jgi:glutathione S-transferase